MISIIVPVYNVEKYLERCVQSILNQTYKDYEILLIDDGSTDSSGDICDHLAAEYEKIRVIHQINQGLSGARNTGIEESKGRYIAFIDSDDFIDKRYLEILFSNLIKYNADVSCCGHYRTEDIVPKQENPVGKEYTFENDECAVFYLEKEIPSAWAKLYKRELFSMLRFPVGRIYEDVAINFKIMMQVDKIVYTDKKLYYYYKNWSSITKQKFTSKTLDLMKAWEEVDEYAKDSTDKIKRLVRFRLNKSYFTLLGMIAYYGMDSSDENKKSEKLILEHFRSTYMNLIKSPFMPLKKKFAVLCLRYFWKLTCLVGSFIRINTGR